MVSVAINVKGVSYSCEPTLGGMIRFKKTTGKEVTDLDPTNLEELAVYLWACAASNAVAEGKEFDYDAQSFADHIPVATMNQWVQSIMAPAEEPAKGSKKK